MKRSRSWPGLCAGLILATPALVGQPAETQPAKARTGETSPAAPIGPPVVTLVEAGAGPHRPLRLGPMVGVPEMIEKTLHADSDESLGGVAMPKQKIPALRHTLEVVVTGVEDPGDVSYDLTYKTADVVDEPGVNPLVRESFRGMLKMIEGLRGKGIITDQGYSKALKFEGTADMAPALLQQLGEMERSMAQLVSSFPSEPVGVGAVWQVESTFEQRGLLIRQTSVVKLLADDGDRIELKTDVCQDARPQKFEALGMGPMSLKAYEAEGTVSTVLRLSRLLPESLLTTMTVDITFLVGSPGAEQELQKHVELRSEAKTK